MKAKSIIYTAVGEPVRSPEALEELIERLDTLPRDGTLHLRRLTSHGSVHDCYLATPLIVRLESL